jgi:hypothetical protein
MENDVEKRLSRLENQLKLYKFGILALAIVAAATVSAYVSSSSADKTVLRAQGLIIEDDAGRPRVAIGAPLQEMSGRNRTDELIGIVYIDENGTDRLTFGKAPDPMTVEGIKPRRVAGAGILIHDKDGVERGGYSALDDDTALLTIDWPKTGEAAVMSSGNGFSGIALFHKSGLGVYREAITFGVESDGDKSFGKITDAAGTERFSLRTEGTQEPVLKRQSDAGRAEPSEP